MKTKHTLTRDAIADGFEFEVTVESTFHPFCRGATDGRFGPPIEPDEPAHLEIEGVEDSAGTAIFLTEDEEDAIIVEIGESMNDESLD